MHIIQWTGVVIFGILSVSCLLAALGIFVAYFIAHLAALFLFLAPVLASFGHMILASFAFSILFLVCIFTVNKICTWETEKEYAENILLKTKKSIKIKTKKKKTTTSKTKTKTIKKKKKHRMCLNV